MTCFSHLSCWTRPWRRKVQQPPEFLDLSEAPKVHHPSQAPQVDDATILAHCVDDDGSSAKKHKIWKKGGNGAFGDLHGALGTLDGYAGELLPAATRGLGCLGWVNPVP